MTIGMPGEEEEEDTPVSDHFKINAANNAQIKLVHKYFLGDVEKHNATFCVRFDPNVKYLAAGKGDGTIQIFNTLTGKMTYSLNVGMEEPKPMTNLVWRPLNGPGITKNVMISVNANGSVQHWHTTSGRLLHTI